MKDVPAVDKVAGPAKQCVRSYNVQEAHSAIFLWFGVTTDQQPDKLTFPVNSPIWKTSATSSAPRG